MRRLADQASAKTIVTGASDLDDLAGRHELAGRFFDLERHDRVVNLPFALSSLKEKTRSSRLSGTRGSRPAGSKGQSCRCELACSLRLGPGSPGNIAKSVCAPRVPSFSIGTTPTDPAP